MPCKPCSCGQADDHVVSRRKTFDDVTVERWHSGAITGSFGIFPPGTAPSKWAHRRQVVADLVWERVCLFTWAELPKLIRTARRAVRQRSLDPSAYLWRSLDGEKFRRGGRRGNVIYSTRGTTT